MVSYIAVCNGSKHRHLLPAHCNSSQSYKHGREEPNLTLQCSPHAVQSAAQTAYNKHWRELGMRLTMGITCPKLDLSHPPVRWPSLRDYDPSSLSPTAPPPPDTESMVVIF